MIDCDVCIHKEVCSNKGKKDGCEHFSERLYILYVCDQKQCKNCHAPQCLLTSDIRHAANFEWQSMGIFTEKKYWINAGGRLPDENGWYLVTLENDIVTMAEYFTENKAFGIYIGKTESSVQDFIKWDVKAWNYLPEAYKEEGDQK